MAEQPEEREPFEIMENSMMQFNEAMRLREELSVRIGRRTSQIIRVGAISVSLLSLAVVYLTYALKTDMQNMSGYMEQMTGMMQSMTTAIAYMPEMNASIQNMNSHIALIQQDLNGMNTSVGSMDRQMDHLRSMDVQMDYLRSMSGDMSGLRQDVNFMNQHVAGMNHQMGALTGSVGAMGYNVKRMAAPAKMLPFP
ncbi:MAG: hypothetical protein WBO06_03340 [Gammaproteobacteria bacterium]